MLGRGPVNLLPPLDSALQIASIASSICFTTFPDGISSAILPKVSRSLTHLSNRLRVRWEDGKGTEMLNVSIAYGLLGRKYVRQERSGYACARGLGAWI